MNSIPSQGPVAGLMKREEGSTLVEYAVALPVLALLLVGIVELSMILLVSVLAEGGVREASRFGITGQLEAEGTRADRIVAVVQDHAHGLVTVDVENVTTLVYPGFDRIGQAESFEDTAPANGAYDPGESFDDVNGNGVWDADMGTPGAGGPGDVVFYRVTYQWQVLTALFAAIVGHDGIVEMDATIAVRNEPFEPS